jgi:hypothetical protein
MNRKFFSLSAAALMLSALSTQVIADGNSTSITTKPRPVRTESEYKPHFGVQAGFTNPNGSYKPALDYCLDLGFQPYVPFGLGLELGHSSSESTINQPDLVRTRLLAKGTYNFGGTIPVVRYSYLGVGLGTSFESGTTLLISTPVAGFDIPLVGSKTEEVGSLSLGAVAKYMIYEGSNPNAFSLNGVVKAWF